LAQYKNMFIELL